MTFERKEGKFILIGSIEKKKSQYKVKIQSTFETKDFLSLSPADPTRMIRSGRNSTFIH